MVFLVGWVFLMSEAPLYKVVEEARTRLVAGNPGANLKLTFHGCHPILVAFVRELTQETIDLPLGGG